MGLVFQQELPGINKTQLLIDSGMVDAVASLLKVCRRPALAHA